jgi:hypothetical protein
LTEDDASLLGASVFNGTKDAEGLMAWHNAKMAKVFCTMNMVLSPFLSLSLDAFGL